MFLRGDEPTPLERDVAGEINFINKEEPFPRDFVNEVKNLFTEDEVSLDKFEAIERSLVVLKVPFITINREREHPFILCPYPNYSEGTFSLGFVGTSEPHNCPGVLEVIESVLGMLNLREDREL